MSNFAMGIALFLLVNVAVGLLRVWWGPTAHDRMLSSQLFGTSGAAILVLLAEGMSMPSLRDVAIVAGLLSAIATIVFVRRIVPSPPEDPKDRAVS